MMSKIYGLLWFAVALVTGVFLIAGRLTLTGVLVFGFTVFGLAFMGMMGMFPKNAVRPAPSKLTVEKKEVKAAEDRGNVHDDARSAHA